MLRLSFLLLCLVLLPLPAGAEQLPTSRAAIKSSFAPLVKQTAPAVVNIYTSTLVKQRLMMPLLDDPVFQQFFGVAPGMTRERMENSLGSGVIVRGDGLVVTSAHVVQGADEIRIVLADRREFSAKLLTVDQRTDLAVIRIEHAGEDMPYLELADSDTAEVGDLVLAIGNPFGVGQTVTSGIVSAIARTGVEINDLNYFIQTDAAINPGNSGGALIGLDGRLLGINAAIYTRSGGNMGIGFAVPSNMVRAVIDAVGQGKQRVVRPWLGFDGQSITAELAASLGLTRPSGVVVSQLLPESPLAKAGLKVGDVITALNGRAIDDLPSFRFRAATLPVGSTATLGVLRLGKPMDVSFPLIAPPEVPPRQETVITGRNILSGVKVANLSPAVAEELSLGDASSGVVVLGGGGYGLNLRSGDRILALNNVAVKSVDMLLALLKEPLRRYQLRIMRDGQVLNYLIGG